MNQAEWLEVAALVVDLWPAQPWTPESVAASFPLVQRFNQKAAIEAVRFLCEEGREFAPPPGLVIAHTRALNQVPSLPEPDLMRDLTPDELARSRDIAARLRRLVGA